MPTAELVREYLKPDAEWRTWPLAKKRKLRRELAKARASQRMRDWRRFARLKQLPPNDPRHGYAHRVNLKTGGTSVLPPCRCHSKFIRPSTGWVPDDEWNVWLLLSGRGFGKTWVGASWVAEQALTNPNSAWAIIAPTFSDTRRVCIEGGGSGLLRAISKEELVSYRRNDLEIELVNGSVIYGFSADRPDRVRGSNLWGGWADELGAWRYDATWHEGLMPALRIGEKPRMIVTTTPRGTKLLRDLAERDDGSVHMTQGSTLDNQENLSASALKELYLRYGGTRVGRQELDGELMSDVEGALWQRAWLDNQRLSGVLRKDGELVMDSLPPMARVVVAMDPSTTSKNTSAEFGIMVVGLGTDGHVYLLADLSGRMTPGKAMRIAAKAFYDWQADRVIGEANNGGDFIEELLRTVEENIPYRTVTASRGKQVRAEPISSIYEQGRAHHLGVFPELERQLCSWTPLDRESPDRLDALVWGMTELTQNADWTTLYGTPYTCPRCDKLSILMAERPRCPHCGDPIDPGLVAMLNRG